MDRCSSRNNNVEMLIKFKIEYSLIQLWCPGKRMHLFIDREIDASCVDIISFVIFSRTIDVGGTNLLFFYIFSSPPCLSFLFHFKEIFLRPIQVLRIGIVRWRFP